MIVQNSEPVTLIGGARVTQGCLERALAKAPYLVAADSGADQALRLGHRPKAVIGDFDSISDQTRHKLPDEIQHHMAEQDSTDFDKCLRNIDAPLVVAVGFSGARLDHQLAVLNSLVRHPGRRCILLGPEEVVFVCPPSFALDPAPGTPVSLFPMGAVEGVSDGLRWPIGGLSFAPDGRIGTSNEATGPFNIAVTAPKMLMALPTACFEPVIEAFLQNPAKWPRANPGRSISSLAR